MVMIYFVIEPGQEYIKDFHYFKKPLYGKLYGITMRALENQHKGNKVKCFVKLATIRDFVEESLEEQKDSYDEESDAIKTMNNNIIVMKNSLELHKGLYIAFRINEKIMSNLDIEIIGLVSSKQINKRYKGKRCLTYMNLS